MARLLAFAFLLLGFALAGVSYAADSSSPSPPTTTTSNTIVKSPPVPPVENNSTVGTDYTDYEIPVDLAPGGVEVVDDYAPFNTGRGPDELAQPEEDLKSKGSEPKNSASSFSLSSYVVFVGAAGLFLF